ncbi:hypothetical protein [Streptomyces sp. A012304]|uniref:hypothetical protein n=1 Tax=Streptomyces sp. A012304 TaxID=375446 RepID=UPI0022323074|nr:hypothetical protein [Streptomyces sp. A012304]GKQ34436.1 hypothetical protein ALMP_09860 [Streptomyces sp. A012304]
MASKTDPKNRASGTAARRRTAAAARPKQVGGGATSVAQVRLRPDELEDLQQVMQTLKLHSLSDALREGLRLLSREAAEVAASREIREFYQGSQAPTPAGVLPATEDELAAADETEW